MGLLNALLQRLSQGEQVPKLRFTDGGARVMTQIQQILYTKRSRGQGEHKGEFDFHHNALGILTAVQQADNGGRHVDIHVSPMQAIGLLTEEYLHLASRTEEHTATLERGDDTSVVKLLHGLRHHGEKTER